MQKNKPSKLLVLLPSFQRSGPMTGVYNILKHLDKKKIEIHIIALKPSPIHCQLDNFRQITDYISIYNRSLILILFNLYKVQKYVKYHKINTVYSTGILPDIINSLLPKKIKKITTVRNTVSDDLEMTYGFLKGKILSAIWKQRFLHIDHVIGHSKSINNNLKGINTKLIYNGSEVEEIQKHKESQKDIRKELGFGDDDLVIGHVGHHSKLKNIEIILKAMQYLDRNIKFVSFGAGPLTSRLVEQAKKMNLSDRIIWFGYTRNIYAYVWGLDIFILPSYSEGLSRALLDSFSAEKPVIVSNIPSSKEIVSEGKNGYIIEPDDDKALAVAINKLSNPKIRKKIGEQNYHDVVKYYNAKQMSNEYEKIFLR